MIDGPPAELQSPEAEVIAGIAAVPLAPEMSTVVWVRAGEDRERMDALVPA
ncbi:MAG: hypothetical protein JW940_31780 [Polyangiaceae bacterium]|nr:hypothetical protein [Polyangiaceae bacterium]